MDTGQLTSTIISANIDPSTSNDAKVRRLSIIFNMQKIKSMLCKIAFELTGPVIVGNSLRAVGIALRPEDGGFGGGSSGGLTTPSSHPDRY